MAKLLLSAMEKHRISSFRVAHFIGNNSICSLNQHFIPAKTELKGFEKASQHGVVKQIC